jgi:hypothetical protein
MQAQVLPVRMIRCVYDLMWQYIVESHAYTFAIHPWIAYILSNDSNSFVGFVLEHFEAFQLQYVLPTWA